METVLRALLAPMLIGAMLCQPALAQTGPVTYARLTASYFDWTAPVPVQLNVGASVGPNYGQAFWSRYDYMTGESNDCLASSSLGEGFDAKITVTMGGAELRFTPMMGWNCPLSEIVVTCRRTDATDSFFFQGLQLNKYDGRATDERWRVVRNEMVNLECSIPGVDAEYISPDSGQVAEERQVSKANEP